MSKLRLNSLQNPDSSAVNIELTSTGGAVVSGILTASTIDGGTITATNITSTDLTVEGTITYDDVTNVDSVGVITARNGIDVNAGGIDVNAGGINAVGIVTATSFSGEDYLLSAIDASITDTATDIFVYDTSKDSDGGAWRKRTQHTSWYNETLNTSTRGSRREFPAVAVIVAEANTLTIYDGDDPDLPMWMVFNGVGSRGAQTAYYLNSGTLTGISALNGQISVSHYGTVIINMVADSGIYVGSGADANKGTFTKPILERNSVQGYMSPILAAVHYDHNDVAMTVLPNAPIDSATGLPVPTIAVATDGGVSVIKDDGTVVDIVSSYAPTNNSDYVEFTKSGGLILDMGHNGDRSWLHTFNVIPSSDTTVTVNTKNAASGSNPVGWYDVTTVFGADLIVLSDGQSDQIDTRTLYGDTIVATTGEGMTFIDEYTPSPSNGMVAYVTTSYNTGWMHGNIKGAFLSDTDTTNVTGGNIVTNGDTWTGASSSTSSTPPNGWTGGNAAQWRTATGGDGSYIRLVNAGSSQGGPNSYMYQAITTVPGRKYKISLTQYHHATISVYYSVGTSINGGDLVTSTWVSSSSNTPRDEHNTFTATGTTTYLTLGITSGTNNYDTGWDNVVITEVVDDRSVNANGLHSFGTITKSAVATGAELVGYSFGSNSNYLEQPYNSGLDYGTGDMYYSMWIYASSSDTFGGDTYIFERTSIGDSSNRRIEARMTTSTRLEIYANGQTLDNNVSVPADSWYKLDILRRSGEAFVYINGEYHSSTTGGAATGSLTDTNARLIIGNRGYFSPLASAWPSNSKIALFRTGASAPTAEQVKQMYADEKFLFQENTKATLYGSSDEVTAMAYDEDTELLHVGTSAGRSDFQGLRRINNTTTAVTTAISASGELIAEQ